MSTIIKDLADIQHKLKAPKGQFNSFGKYKYRSCEDILEAVKPLLAEKSLVLTLEDDIALIGERFYVKATVKVMDAQGGIVTTTAYAREDETKKGMDASQITGSCSSYARKYALSGLFAIDDTKDSDALVPTDEAPATPVKTKPATDTEMTALKEQFNAMCKNHKLNGGAILKYYDLAPKTITKEQLVQLVSGIEGMLSDPKAINELPKEWRMN